MTKSQEESRASDSTQWRKVETKDPNIEQLSGQHYGHYAGNRITIGHRDHYEPAWRTRRGSRGRLGQTTEHGGAGATHETRSSGIRQDSTLHISLKKIDIPTPGSLRTSDSRHRTARNRHRRSGRAHQKTVQRRRKRPVHRAQVRTTLWISPCKIRRSDNPERTAAGACPPHSISGHPAVTGKRNAIPYANTCATKPLPTPTLLGHDLLAQG